MKKHTDIWLHWALRRLWPVYLEYLAGIVWSISLLSLVVTWCVIALLYALHFMQHTPPQMFLPPPWTGSVLALMCLIQFMMSFYLDHHYENESLFRYYIWIIWYPLFYWTINALALYTAIYKVATKKKGASAIWESPDRGIHTLQ